MPLDHDPTLVTPTANPLRILLCSPLSPAECAARLAPLVDVSRSLFNGWVNLTGARAVVGRATDRTLLVRRRTAWGMGLQGVLKGTLNPAAGGGTVISGRMTWIPQSWMVAVWLWICTLIAGMMLIEDLSRFFLVEAGHPQHDGAGVVLPVATLAAVLGVQILAHWRMREDAAFFRELLLRHCDAISCLPPPPTQS